MFDFLISIGDKSNESIGIIQKFKIEILMETRNISLMKPKKYEN